MKKTLAPLLREWQKQLEEWNGNAASNDQFELEFILNVLETHSVTAYQFEERDKNARKLESIR